MEKNKLMLSPKRLIITFSGLCLLIEVLIIGGGFLLSWEYMVQNWITILIIVASVILGCGLLCFLALKTSYYLLDKRGIYYHKPGGDVLFEFKTFRWIDEKYSKKHHVMRVFDDKGKETYIVFDSKGLIYDYALKYSDKLMSDEEFKMRFPNIKI